MQNTGKILPFFIDADGSYNNMKEDTSPFMKGLTWDINGNPNTGIGTGNASGEGQNLMVLTPSRSNEKVPGSVLPAGGLNKNVGNFESRLTKELYAFTYNSLGKHSISVLNGDTGLWSPVITDPKLNFSDDQEAFIAGVRVTLRVVTDETNQVIEKHLMWTDGRKWQGWINVVAAMATNGFNETSFPYWKTQPPHFDREELLEWPVRPPMVRPDVQIIPNTTNDYGKVNRIVDRAFRFSIAFENTDGRISTPSPYSRPLLVKSVEYINNPNFLPRNAKLILPGGSPLTERVKIFVSIAGDKNSIDPLSVWGDWKLYDTIDKYATPANQAYWLRTNPFPGMAYDTVFNQFEYIFDNSKVGKFISQDDMNMIETAMPQVSQCLSDMDDSVLLVGNRYFYNNFSQALINKLTAVVKDKPVNACIRPLRTIVLYAYIGKRSSGRSQTENFAYQSQPLYTYGDDKKVRFGGVNMAQLGNEAEVFYDDSKSFDLDLADKRGLRCYLKGTPYYADSELCMVKADNSIELMPNILDLSLPDNRKTIQSIYQSGSYFACRFTFKVPAGRYTAAIGRHNVDSSGDYRNTSTYTYGIANSRQKSVVAIPGVVGRNLVTINYNALVANANNSKEMELDCTAGDLDTWGNGKDLFYIYCPHNQYTTRFRFIEGYFKETQGSPVPVELFPYQMTLGGGDDWGRQTDKNGFYWGFTRIAASSSVQIQMVAKVNCGYPTVFNLPNSQAGLGWLKNADTYLGSYTNNNGLVGDCNRVLIKGRVTDLAGTIGYSNIGVSVVDGPTVYTDSDGNFTLITHNGKNSTRVNNIYVNAGGNYVITGANCGQIPLLSFTEPFCPICQVRSVTLNPLPIQIVQSEGETSLKSAGKYNVGFVVADLAGRMTFVNVANDVEVQSFMKRGSINATFIQLVINSAINFLNENPDARWFSPYVSSNTNAKRYLQWAADSIQYLDSNGAIVQDSNTASFVRIVMDSLYKANIASNFTLFSNYQFVKGDRVIIMDDGAGNLFNTATYGEPIDIPVLGTNYNEAAINAGLLMPNSNVVLDNSKVTLTKDIGLIVKYDSRLNRLFEKKGFWVEVYTPSQLSDVVPFFEIAGFMPIINGSIAQFVGYNNGQPNYSFPNTIDIDFWDTYYLQRSISGQYYNHPFESPNVTDTWGAQVTSGGRLSVENKDAQQEWFGGGTIRSDSFTYINGLATFRSKNKKDYGVYPYGPIVAAHTKRNMIAFNCTNDWFVAEFNMPYTKVSNGQLVVTNLDENLSLPMKKEGPMYGIEKKDIANLVVDENFFFWFDRKNTAIPKCNYSEAIDISQLQGEERGGIQAYLNTKSGFIGNWDALHDKKDQFDVVAGIDSERGNIYFTFRPRRNNSNDPYSYVNNKRFLDLKSQETFVYSVQYKGWLPCTNFTPESYARLRGRWANVEFISFAAGVPYIHNNSSNQSYLNYYGVQCEPVFVGVFNKGEGNNILGSILQEINGSSFFIDNMFGIQQNSFSLIPMSLWKEKEKNMYASVLRDMSSYPPIKPELSFQSMLFDGKRMFGPYVVCRFVQQFEDLGKYFQLTGASYLFTNSFPDKP